MIAWKYAQIRCIMLLVLGTDSEFRIQETATIQIFLNYFRWLVLMQGTQGIFHLFLFTDFSIKENEDRM